MYPESKLRIERLLSGGNSGAKKKYSLSCNSCGCDHNATKPHWKAAAGNRHVKKKNTPTSSGLFTSLLKCKEDFQRNQETHAGSMLLPTTGKGSKGSAGIRHWHVWSTQQESLSRSRQAQAEPSCCSEDLRQLLQVFARPAQFTQERCHRFYQALPNMLAFDSNNNQNNHVPSPIVPFEMVSSSSVLDDLGFISNLLQESNRHRRLPGLPVGAAERTQNRIDEPGWF